MNAIYLAFVYALNITLLFIFSQVKNHLLALFYTLLLNTYKNGIIIAMEGSESSVSKLLGTNVQKYRKNKNLTQTELAEKLGISQKHLSDIETGTKFPSAGLIEKLAKELNVSVAFLFGGSDPSVSDISNNVATLIMNQLSPTLNDMSQDVEDIKKMLKNLKITM